MHGSAAVIFSPFRELYVFDGTVLNIGIISRSCCQIDGDCCKSGDESTRDFIGSTRADLCMLPIGCCAPGTYCYSTGCCKNGSRGCEGNSCCAPGESCCSGGGCCKQGYVSNFPTLRQFPDFVGFRYYCTVVNGKRGCCPNGKTCTCDPPPKCTNPNYVLCPGENFCCRGFTFIVMNWFTLLNIFHLQRRDTNATEALTIPLLAAPHLAHTPIILSRS